MPGWRWIFTIDAVISLPIAIAAFFFIPDLPSVIKPGWIFKQDDIDLANKRLASVGRVGPKKGGLGLKAIWKILTTWEIFVFTFVYSCYIFSQSELWSRSSIIANVRPTAVYGVLAQTIGKSQVYHPANQLLPLWNLDSPDPLCFGIRLGFGLRLERSSMASSHLCRCKSSLTSRTHADDSSGTV